MIAFILLGFLFTSISGHIALSFPTPRNPNSGIKSYPCGNDPFFGPGQTITSISPGPLTITWGETINHIGAPYRIAISVGDDLGYDDFILVDHIPHNDPGGGSFSNPKPHQFTICIPDINCPQCSLQVINAMTDKIGQGQCCPYPPPINGFCNSVYHTCANIAINGTQSPQAYLATHQNPPRTADTNPYGRESGTWMQGPDGVNFLPNDPTISFNPATCPAGGSQTGISYASSEMLGICGSADMGGTVINQQDFAGQGSPTARTQSATGADTTSSSSTSSSPSPNGAQSSDESNFNDMDVIMTAGIIVILIPAFCLLVIGGIFYFGFYKKLQE